MPSVDLVCSNRPRPSVQKGAKGNQHWTREVFHARKSAIDTRTLCGAPCTEWLMIEARDTGAVMDDHHFCKRCKTKLNDTLPF